MLDNLLGWLLLLGRAEKPLELLIGCIIGFEAILLVIVNVVLSRRLPQVLPYILLIAVPLLGVVLFQFIV